MPKDVEAKCIGFCMMGQGKLKAFLLGMQQKGKVESMLIITAKQDAIESIEDDAEGFAEFINEDYPELNLQIKILNAMNLEHQRLANRMDSMGKLIWQRKCGKKGTGNES